MEKLSNFSLQNDKQNTLQGRGYIKNIEKNHITGEIIQRIYEIEKDMWSHGLGEYMKCDDCGNIYSKEDIWSDIPQEDTKKTVSFLEKKYGEHLECSECSGQTKYIFGEEYKFEIRRRQSHDDYFLSLFFDDSSNIQGFFDGYIGSFEDLYTNEFEHYYGKEARANIKEKIKSILNFQEGKKFLCPTAMGTEQKYGTMYNLYDLMKSFYSKVYEKHGEIDALYEAVLGTNLYAFYIVTGAERSYISNNQIVNNTHNKFKSDILIHRNITSDGITSLGTSCLDFFKKNKQDIRKIIEMTRY